MDEQSLATLNRSERLKRMLTADMPRMRPSALKHESLATVANVLNHPVATTVDKDAGLAYQIGWGDYERTMPMVIIRAQSPEGTPAQLRHPVIHAHVPYTYIGRDTSPKTRKEREIQRDLVDKLQAEEVEWAANHGVAPRTDIVQQIRSTTTDVLNQRGLTPNPAPSSPESMRADFARGGWYETCTFASHEELASEPVLLANDNVFTHIEHNVNDAVDMQVRNHGLRANVKLSQRHREDNDMRLLSIEIAERDRAEDSRHADGLQF